MSQTNFSVKFTATDKFTGTSKKINKALRSTQKEFDNLDRRMKASGRVATTQSKKMSGLFAFGGKMAAGVGAALGGRQIMRGLNIGVQDQLAMDKIINRILQVVAPENFQKVEGRMRKWIIAQSKATGMSWETLGAGAFDQATATGGFDDEGDWTNLSNALKISTASTANLSNVILGASKSQKVNKDWGTLQLGMAAFATQRFGMTTVEGALNQLPNSAVLAKYFGWDPGTTMALFGAASNKLANIDQGADAIMDIYSTLATSFAITGGNWQMLKQMNLPTGHEVRKMQPLEVLEQVAAAANNPAYTPWFDSVFNRVGARRLGKGFDDQFRIDFQNMKQTGDKQFIDGIDVSDLGYHYNRATGFNTLIRAQSQLSGEARHLSLLTGEATSPVLGVGAGILRNSRLKAEREGTGLFSFELHGKDGQSHTQRKFGPQVQSYEGYIPEVMGRSLRAMWDMSMEGGTTGVKKRQATEAESLKLDINVSSSEGLDVEVIDRSVSERLNLGGQAGTE